LQFTSVDPLAEKHPEISPYAFCANNPMNRIDNDGMDWTITTEQKDGQTIYHITVNASLYNNSSTNYSQKQMDQLAGNIKSQCMEAFNTSGKGYSVDFKMNLNVAKSTDDIKSTDHVFQIVDQNVVGKGANGDGEVNGLNIRMGTTAVNDILNGDNNRSAAHELGHTGGLDDANINLKQSNQLGVILNTNLMSQSKYVDDHGGDGVNANNLTQGQINYIYNNRNNLNQNSPIIREPVYTNIPMKSYLLLNLHLVPSTTLRK